MTITDMPLYRNTSASIDDRVADLLSRMSVDEKLAQLGSLWVFQIANHQGFEPERAAPLLAHGLGHVTRMCGASSLTAEAAARLANDVQRHLLDHTRLGIPAIVHEEICSGLMARDATSFPQAIGVASTWRPELNRAIADTIRAQMRAIGAHLGLSPVLDVCRDPRWGRLEETYGEDAFLVTQMGLEFVGGLQGEDLRQGVAATAKHFVGYGASDGGFNWAPARLPERELRDVYLRPFEAAVRVAGLESVMNGYHELDGIPCGANRWLLTDLLRGEWGFAGTVVSDYFAVKQLSDYHHIVDGPEAAAVTGIRSGIDIELPSTDCYGDPLRDAIETGGIDIADVDAAVAHALAQKFRLGLFEQPFVDVDKVALHTRTDAQRALALESARDSLILLKNEGVLPLDPTTASIAVIGPNAANARNMLGDYSYIAHVESLIEVLKSGQNVFAMPIEHGVDLDPDSDLSSVGTVHRALSEALPSTEIRYALGCGVTDDDRSGFDEAVEAARSSSVAIMVMGERSGLTADCTTGESRDVSSLDLPGVQEQLVLAVAATGTPVILVLVAGRPIGSMSVHAAASAVLMAWLPGEQGAAAVAEALTGAFSPGGKLPVSYPRSSGQIPVFYGHKVSGGRSHWKGEYVDLSNEPMYPFGFGLGYSEFTIVPAPIATPSVATGDTVVVTVSVTNVGAIRADEVVQVYSRDPVATVTRPVLELQAFTRVTLDPGQSAQIEFEIAVADLGFHDRNFRYVVEPGAIDLMVGNSTTSLIPAGTITVTGDDPTPTRRTFGRVVRVSPA